MKDETNKEHQVNHKKNMIPTPWQKELDDVKKAQEWIDAYHSKSNENQDCILRFSYCSDKDWRPYPDGLARELSNLVKIQSTDLMNAALDSLREKLKEAKIQAKEDLTVMLVEACTE